MSARADGRPARVLARLYCLPAQRAVFDALLALETEVRAGIDRGLEHDIAHARLNFWREEFARLSAGRPQHPLTRTLAAQFASGVTALAGLSGFADAATWDLAAATFESRRELSAYCARWSAAFAEPFAAFADPGRAPETVSAFGCALAELELLNGLSAAARHGRIRLPLEELETAQVRPEELAQGTFGGPLCELIRGNHARARAALARSSGTLGTAEQPALRALLVWGAIVTLQSHRAVAALPRASSRATIRPRLTGGVPGAPRGARTAAASACPTTSDGELLDSPI